PERLDVLCGRGPAHVLRLSAIFALLDCQPEIKSRHLRSALAWWDYSVQSIELLFPDRTGNPDADRILAAMRPGDSMTKNEIRETIFANHPAGDLDEAIAVLADRDDFEVKIEPTAGRPRKVVTRLTPAERRNVRGRPTPFSHSASRPADVKPTR